MSLRALAALAVVLAAAVAAILWVGRKPAEDAKGTPAESTLLTLAAKDVAAIEVTRAGAAFRLERRPEVGWVLTRPALEEARVEAAEALVAGVVGARVRRVLEPRLAEGSRASYGLEAPEAVATLFATRGGTAPVTVRVGGTSPVSPDRYVLDGSGRLLLVEAGLAASLDTSREDLAERHLLAAEPSEVQALRVTRPEGTVVLERDPLGWTMKEPIADRADAADADAWVRLLTGLTRSRPLREGVEGERALGLLTHAAVRVSVTLTGERKAPEIALASSGPLGTADDPERYASRDARVPGAAPVAGPVPAEALDDLRRPVDALRDPDVVGLDPPQVLEVRIRAEGHELHLRRAEGVGWTAREDGKDAPVPEPARVAGWLDRVRALRASGFAPPGAAFAPLRSLALLLRDGTTVTLEVGAQEGQRVPVRGSRRPAVVAWVASEAVPPWPTRVAGLPGPEGP